MEEHDSLRRMGRAHGEFGQHRRKRERFGKFEKFHGRMVANEEWPHIRRGTLLSDATRLWQSES